MMRFNSNKAMFHMIAMLAYISYIVESSPTNLQLPPKIHHYLKKRLPKFFQRQRNRVTSYSSDRTNQIQYPWRQQHIITDTKQSAFGSLLLMQSATKFLTLLPHKQHILTGVAAYYVFHKVRKSEPIQRSIYFWTHAGPVVFHYKFTKWWFTAHPKISRMERDAVYERLHNKYAPITYQIILHLRGLYVKMGQILSSRPDFMPIQYIQYFTKLQDSIPAIDTETIRRTAVEALQKRCSDAYSEYDTIVLDPVPLGSASIGQVHRAVLYRKAADKTANSSQEVAIKVMHENAKQKFQTDFQVFRWLCRIAIPSWLSLLHALEEQVMTEFDYCREARSLQTVRDSIMHSSSQYRHRVCVPKPIHELCCENVLVMEMLHGKKLIDSIRGSLVDAFHNNTLQVDKFLQQRQQEVLLGHVQNNAKHSGNDQTSGRDHRGGIPISKATLSSHEILNSSVGFLGKIKLLLLLQQCRSVIDLLVDVHGYQIFHKGVWNGDPHFGNCMKLDDGRLGLIDYGQTRHISDNERMNFARIVVALNQKVMAGHSKHPEIKYQRNITHVAHTMRMAGFVTRNNTDDDVLFHYAQLIFDSDEESVRRGFSIPQEYFKSLMDTNPLLSIPDSAVFVARTSLLFRGMGNAVGSGQIRTSLRWYEHALKALEGFVEPSSTSV